MSILIDVSSVHMDHKSGTKEYWIDHVKIIDKRDSVHELHVDHTVFRWGAVGKRAQSKVEPDPGYTRFEAVKAQKIGRGYSDPGTRSFHYDGLSSFALEHNKVFEVLNNRGIIPEELKLTLASIEAEAKQAKAERFTHIPEPDFDVTEMNPNLGMF